MRRPNALCMASMSLDADFDGDGQTDLVMDRPSIGTWYVENYSDANWTLYPWGLASDTPL